MTEKPLPRQFIAFHGTRCPVSVIRKKGIVFDPSFLMKLLRKTAKRLKINYRKWLDFEYNCYLGRHFIDMIYGRNDFEYRPYVSITSNYANASAYAYRNPELIFDAVAHMVAFKYKDSPSWNKHKVFAEQKREIYKTLNSIGKPKVVVVDVRKLVYTLPSGEVVSRAKGLTYGDVNVYVDRIPPSAIITIKPAKYQR